MQPAPIGSIVPAPLRAEDDPPPRSDPLLHLDAWRQRFGALPASPDGLTEVLFITNDLNIGGAQRSLTNLLTTLDGQPHAWLCVLDRLNMDAFLDEIAAQSVPAVTCAGLNQAERIEAALQLIEYLRPRTLCFWNVEAGVKLLMTAVLAQAGIRIVDVSPGPLMFARLDAKQELQQRSGFFLADYFRRLDMLVAKYHGGIPQAFAKLPRATAVIPNGVAQMTAPPLLDLAMRPASVDPDAAIVTCCRLMPEKRVEWLIPMMEALIAIEPRASLTIVGGADERVPDYLPTLQESIRRRGLAQAIHFAGANPDTASFLGLFRVFVMIAEGQGCPNASLEAMASGLPVVANDDGGTREQIAEGINGYLVSGTDPAEMAVKVAALLADPMGAAAMGAEGRRIAAETFSMQEMVERYRRIL